MGVSLYVLSGIEGDNRRIMRRAAAAYKPG
jgi:hypothetical protein